MNTTNFFIWVTLILLGVGSLVKSERISRLEGRIRHLENSAHQHQHQHQHQP